MKHIVFNRVDRSDGVCESKREGHVNGPKGGKKNSSRVDRARILESHRPMHL